MYKVIIPVFLFLVHGMSQTSHAAIIASEYRAIPCSEYAPGCPTEQRNLAPGTTFDPFSWTNFWRQYHPGDDHVGYMRALDSNDDGWIVGYVNVMIWNESSWGPWDGTTQRGSDGSTYFVYHPNRGAVCCITDDPFRIFAISDDGYIFTNGFVGRGNSGILHVSAIDLYPTGMNLNVTGPFPSGWPPFFTAVHGRNSLGVLHVGDGWDEGPRFALLPVEIPEPATALLSSLGIVIVVLLRNRN